MEEKKCENEKLTTKVKCTEEEICTVRKELNECVRERNQLTDAITLMAMDLKCVTSKLSETESHMADMEEKYTLERDTLKNTLDEVEKQYEEANCKIIDGKHKIKILTTSLKELKEASEKSHCEMKIQIKKLKDDICLKDDDISNLKQKINELNRENEFNVMEINELKNKLCDKESLLNEFKLLMEGNNIEGPPIKTKCNSCCCSEILTSNICGSNSLDSASDTCCSITKHIKALSQKYASKGSKYNNVCVTTDLKNLQCDIENLKSDVSKIKK